MFNWTEDWVSIFLDGVMVSSWGRVRHHGKLVDPTFKKSFGWVYIITQGNKMHFLNIKLLLLQYFPHVKLKLSVKWAKHIRYLNAKDKALPEIEENPPKRKCHDCGRPTNNYRCAECWQRLREKQSRSYEQDPDISHY